MLSTCIRQKDSVFYFVAYPAEDLLRKVHFISRYYADHDILNQQKEVPADDVAAFIKQIEKSDSAFQRAVSKRKVEAIKNFYETAISQPPIPGTVLLFTSETLNFTPLGNTPTMGNLEEPQSKYLIIDGQHRLAALHFYLKTHPEDCNNLHVPCIIFDGRSDDFATEMFVIINSTPTRINKSHLIDLYEKISWTSPDKKTAARVTNMLYSNDDSPLRYRINRLGGRSQQKKWILQAELFNEVHKWIANQTEISHGQQVSPLAHYYYESLRDFFKACKIVWEETWNNDNYMVCTGVTLKAMIRVFAKLNDKIDETVPGERIRQWTELIGGWRTLKPEFKRDGFYERFAAKGQVERVKTIQKFLMNNINK
ncbi:MAG: hypothetical protein KatS3mg031_2093 [Chitinophagales bacterium]|nr:MAG: hypothetical protein KatS3mg031_2093 [Chitinophagales bacterium]